MKLILILVAAALVGCSEYRCVDGRMAYRAGDAWVIPADAYRCVPVEKEKP